MNMALQEIRETIEIPETVLDVNGFAIVQKKVNLKPNQLHNVFQMDIFQDAIPSTDDAPEMLIEWFISPYPIIYSNMNVSPAFVNRGASAGSDTVLFKATCSNYNPQNFFDIQQFPNQSIGAQASFTFYTPTVYITGFVHGIADAVVRNLAFSFYIASITKKASLVTYGLGIIRERSVAQGMNLVQQGRTIPPAANVGQVFPMWKYGGIRPERMLKGNNISNFFLNQESDQSETMLSTTVIRNYVAGARKMAGFDQAFGTETPTGDPIPEWIRFGLNRGLVSGPIRSQFPPRKLYDNGNTVML